MLEKHQKAGRKGRKSVAEGGTINSHEVMLGAGKKCSITRSIHRQRGANEVLASAAGSTFEGDFLSDPCGHRINAVRYKWDSGFDTGNDYW